MTFDKLAERTRFYRATDVLKETLLKVAGFDGVAIAVNKYNVVRTLWADEKCIAIAA